MHVFTILGIQACRRIQLMGLMIKQSFTGRKVDSKIWGSPGSRQLLQLQHFPKIQQILGPSFFFLLNSLVCLMFAQRLLLCQRCFMVLIDFSLPSEAFETMSWKRS